MIILVRAIGILTPGATAPINLKLIIGVFNSKYKVVSGNPMATVLPLNKRR